MPNFYRVHFKNFPTAIEGSLPLKGTWNFKGLSFSAEFSSEITFSGHISAFLGS